MIVSIFVFQRSKLTYVRISVTCAEKRARRNIMPGKLCRECVVKVGYECPHGIQRLYAFNGLSLTQECAVSHSAHSGYVKNAA